MSNVLLHLMLLATGLAESQSPVVSFGKSAGVLIDPRGYVVTCHHCVAAHEHWLVKLRDGRRFIGHVVASDPARELALVRLDAGGRRFVAQRLAETPARVRDEVTVIGHPKGWTWTTTVGRVTAVEREVPIDGTPVKGLMQADAAINPGCSGGAVLNGRGELVGVPVAMHSDALGIGFVVPAKQIREFLAKHLPE